MFKTINEFLLISLIYQTLNKTKQKNINEIIKILSSLSKSIIKKEKTNKSKPRIKKRNHGKNKWVSAKKIINKKIIDT